MKNKVTQNNRYFFCLPFLLQFCEFSHIVLKSAYTFYNYIWNCLYISISFVVIAALGQALLCETSSVAAACDVDSALDDSSYCRIGVKPVFICLELGVSQELIISSDSDITIECDI